MSSQEIKKYMTILNEARQVGNSEIEYTEKKVKGAIDKVTAVISGKESAAFTRIGNKYSELDMAIKSLEEEREQLNTETKERMEALFDAQDSVYTRVVDTVSLTLTLSKATEATPDTVKKEVSVDYEALLAELADTIPDMTDVINTLKKKYTKENEKVVKGKSAVPSRLRAPKMKESAELNEGISDWIARFTAWFDKKMSRVDKRLDSIKARIQSA